MKIVLTALLASATAFLASGCATTYRDPATSTVATAKVATLESPFTWESQVFILDVNGKSRGSGVFTKFMLPPGRNTILVTGNGQAHMYEVQTELAFTAEAGRVYSLKYEIIPGASRSKVASFIRERDTYRAWIIDKDTGRPVDEESLRTSAAAK